MIRTLMVAMSAYCWLNQLYSASNRGLPRVHRAPRIDSCQCKQGKLALSRVPEHFTSSNAFIPTGKYACS